MPRRFRRLHCLPLLSQHLVQQRQLSSVGLVVLAAGPALGFAFGGAALPAQFFLDALDGEAFRSVDHAGGLQVALVGGVVEEAVEEGIKQGVVRRNQGLNDALLEVEAFLPLLEHLAAAIGASAAHALTRI